MDTNQPVKKRGRKKKDIVEGPVEPVVVNKRGRKPKVVDFKKSIGGVVNNFDIKEIHLIHLPVSLDEVTGCSDATEITNPANNRSINYDASEYDNLTKKSVPKVCPKTDKPKSVYNCTDRAGNPETIYIHENPILPQEVDYLNVTRIKPEKTDIACWWCCHTFDTYPVCSPIKYNPRKDIFTVEGCFCSFNCAKAYSMREGAGKFGLDSFLYKKVTGQLNQYLPAPPRTVLKMFGGPITIQEYRETFETLSHIKINKYPMVFVSTQVEYHKVTKMINDSNDKIRISKSKQQSQVLSHKNISAAVSRMSISKHEYKGNTLMNVMGIKVKN